jgi:hypothetical protein
LKTVVIRAALNAGTNPATPLEWYVDNVRSNQTGSTFEFTPTIAGAFKVQAKVGATLSNVIDVTVGAGSSTITVSTPVWKTASQVEITGDAGAEVTVTGATLAATSYYDLVAKKYILNFTTPLAQGAELTVTMKKSGSQDRVVKTTYETRKVEVNTFKIDTVAATAEADGSYEVERPNILKPATGFINDLSTAVEIKFKSANLDATLVSYKIERLSAPTGADAFATVQSVVDVAADNAGGLGINLSFDREDALGAYVFRVTLGTTQREVTVNLVEPKATLELVETAIGTPKFKVFYNQTGSATNVGIAAAANGNYEITKDYLTDEYKKFEFTFEASNISVPANLLGTTTQNISTPSNQMLVSLAAPGGLTFMRVNTANGTPQQLQFETKQFRNEEDLRVQQYVDSTTPVGNYVYTVRILQLGTEIHKETVTVTVKDPVATLELSATATDPAALRWESTAVKTAVTATTNAGIPAHVDLDAWIATSANVGARSPVLNSYVLDTTNRKLYQWTFASNNATAPSWIERTSPAYVVVSTAIYKYSSATDTLGYRTSNFGTATPLNASYDHTLNNNDFDVDSGDGITNLFYNLSDRLLYSITNTGGIAITDANTTPNTYLFKDVIGSAGISAELLAHPTTAGAKYFDQAASRLWEVKGDAKATDLTVASKALTVQKPTRTGLDTITVKINAELENFVSPANPTATLANSFVDTEVSPNVVRDFVTYKKSYTGPMTLDAAKNVRDVLAAFIVRKDSTTTAESPYTDYNDNGKRDTANYTLNTVVRSEQNEGIANRLTVDPQGFDKFMSGGATYNIASAFEFPINFETPVGSYVFTLQVGALTETITVNVTAATQTINLVVEDVKTNKLITPASNVYTVQLNETGEAEVAFDYELFNMRPATATGPYTIAFSATTTFPDWSDTRSDTAVFSLVGDNDGVLQSRGTTGLNKVLHRNAPSAGAAASLVLDEVGDYSFSVTVGGATKAWTVRVIAFPTLVESAVYVGTGSEALTPASLALTKIGGIAVTNRNTDKLHFEVTGVNLPATVYYGIEEEKPTIAGATAISNLSEFIYGPAGAAPQMVAPLRSLVFVNGKALIPVTNKKTEGLHSFAVYMYNSDRAVIGYKQFSYTIDNTNTQGKFMLMDGSKYTLVNNTINASFTLDAASGAFHDYTGVDTVFAATAVGPMLLELLATHLKVGLEVVTTDVKTVTAITAVEGALANLTVGSARTITNDKVALDNSLDDIIAWSKIANIATTFATSNVRSTSFVVDIGTAALPNKITVNLSFVKDTVLPRVTQMRIKDGVNFNSIAISATGATSTGTYKWTQSHFDKIQLVFSEPVLIPLQFHITIGGVNFVTAAASATTSQTIVDLKVASATAINLNKFVVGEFPFLIAANSVTDIAGNQLAAHTLTLTFTAP